MPPEEKMAANNLRNEIFGVIGSPTVSSIVGNERLITGAACRFGMLSSLLCGILCRMSFSAFVGLFLFLPDMCRAFLTALP